MVEGFFGHITEMIGNNNPNFLEFARLVSTESFHYLISTITSLGASEISIRRIRDEKPDTYFYSSFDDIDDERKECLLWRFFNPISPGRFNTFSTWGGGFRPPPP